MMHKSYLSDDNNVIVNKIITILSNHLLLHPSINKTVLESVITAQVSNSSRIKMILLAFPCKTSNTNKVMGTLPDMGEYLSLLKIVETIRDLEAIYEFGASLTIFSDFHVFARYINVGENQYYQYYHGLKALVKTLGAEDIIEIDNLQIHPEFDVCQDIFEFQDLLENKFGTPGFRKKIDDKIKTCDKSKKTYICLKRFMAYDLQSRIGHLSKSPRRKELAYITKGMMISGNALDNFLEQKYPNTLRLSIHEYKEIGKKHSISLLDKKNIKTPWHNTVMFDATQGKYIFDKKIDIISQYSQVLTVTLNEQPWMLLHLSLQNIPSEVNLSFLKVSLLQGKFGMMIEVPQDYLSIADLASGDITHLIKEFGFVIFRGFRKYSSTKDLETFYSSRGEMIKWKFGYTHVVKDNEHPGHVNSFQALPVHWDLMNPPVYMGIDQDRHKYEDYIPREFILYCHQSPPPGEGMTSIVNASLATLMIDGKKRETFRETRLSYYTDMTYFGGKSYEYPLIMTCPWTGCNVFRWCERWNKKDKPDSLQHNDYEIVTSKNTISADELEKDLISILKNNLVTLYHQFQEGDCVIVNNYTSLHGRTSFSGKRELWRLQLAPPHGVTSPLKPQGKRA